MSLVSATDSEVMRWLGGRLRALREQQGLTSLEAARLSRLSRRTLYRVERGQNPTLLSVVRLLRLYGHIESLSQFLREPEVSPMALLAAAPRRRRRAPPAASED